jgi:hypothetical protein
MRSRKGKKRNISKAAATREAARQMRGIANRMQIVTGAVQGKGSNGATKLTNSSFIEAGVATGTEQAFEDAGHKWREMEDIKAFL